MYKILSQIVSLSVLFCLVLISQNIFAQFVNPKAGFSKDVNSINALIEKAYKDKNLSVIVGLNINITPEGYLTDDQKHLQQESIKNMQNDLISQLSQYDTKVLAKYKYIPYIAIEADASSLEFLKTSKLVTNVHENKFYEPVLAQSRVAVEANLAEGLGYSGQGQVVAVLDTGVAKNHPFLAGKVVSEACYSRPYFLDEFDDGENTITTEVFNLCGGPTATTGPNTALPCTGNDGCDHGTHVAGIAVGNGTNSGIAKNANLIAIQVFTRRTIRFNGNLTSNALVASDIDILAGMDRVVGLKLTTNHKIAAVNLSIGGNPRTSECGNEFPGYVSAIATLESYNIATVIASGNNNAVNGISAPACVDRAVSVGATTDGSGTPIWSIANFGTNSANFLDLLAPGAVITSSITLNNGFGDKQGTSMAAPHVAGAWAVIRQRFPKASVAQILNALKVSGQSITDNRSGAGGRLKPLIKIAQAITYLENNPPKSAKFDFDGDGKSDASVFRGSEGNWYIDNGTSSPNTYNFGLSSDKLVPADFTGDGRTDLGVWRATTGEWYIFDTASFTYTSYTFGQSGDIPAPGDFDGDGDDEIAIYRPNATPSQGYWYVRNPDGTANVSAFGVAEDKPVVEDYDGDGKDDISVYRPSTGVWYLNRSQAGFFAVQYGQAGDKTVQGDFTGDGKADVAVWRPGNGVWYVIRSEDSSTYAVGYGQNGDIPTPGDYDGDGKQDTAVFRPSTTSSTATWYINKSTNNTNSIFSFGVNSDIPIPSVYNVP